MTILDSTLQLASGYAPTAISTIAAPNQNGTYINFVNAQDWGMGWTPIWYVRVATAWAVTAACSLQFGLFGATSAALLASTPQLIELAPEQALSIATNAIPVGTEWKIPLRRGTMVSGVGQTPKYQFVGLGVIITGAVATSGAVDSWITGPEMVQDNVSYPPAYSVL